MTKTISLRIHNQTHKELTERCNKADCTINEWLSACIDYLLTGSSDFDFGDPDEDDSKLCQCLIL